MWKHIYATSIDYCAMVVLAGYHMNECENIFMLSLSTTVLRWYWQFTTWTNFSYQAIVQSCSSIDNSKNICRTLSFTFSRYVYMIHGLKFLIMQIYFHPLDFYTCYTKCFEEIRLHVWINMVLCYDLFPRLKKSLHKIILYEFIHSLYHFKTVNNCE